MAIFSEAFERKYQGLAQPLTKGAQGYLTLKPSSETIHASLQAILLTQQGERVMLPEYGSKLWYLVGEKNNGLLASLAHTYTVSAIERWEPRVSIIQTNTNIVQNGFELIIVYSIKGIDEVGQIVLPFTLS